RRRCPTAGSRTSSSNQASSGIHPYPRSSEVVMDEEKPGWDKCLLCFLLGLVLGEFAGFLLPVFGKQVNDYLNQPEPQRPVIKAVREPERRETDRLGAP